MMDQNGDVESDKEDEMSSDIDLTEFDENEAVVLWSQPQSTEKKCYSTKCIKKFVSRHIYFSSIYNCYSTKKIYAYRLDHTPTNLH